VLSSDRLELALVLGVLVTVLQNLVSLVSCFLNSLESATFLLLQQRDAVVHLSDVVFDLDAAVAHSLH
jgi:hypothetical protein